MANMPQNIYLQSITGNTLTTVLTPAEDSVYTNLWMLVSNSHTAAVTLSVFHNNGSDDILIAKRTIQSGKTGVFQELSGVKINDAQLLKIQSSDASGTYSVDLSANIVTNT